MNKLIYKRFGAVLPCFWLLGLLWSVAVGAQPVANKVCAHAVDRPCVALVLGGGGARGSAHIGVIKAIEEAQIPIDIVTGTSIGSLVGGLYASGKSASEIEQLFQTMDWNAGYQDDLSRSAIPNRRKRQLDEWPIHLDLGVGLHGIKLPKGFLQGQGMKALVDQILGEYPVFDSFDDLPIPFRAVAADAVTGEEVVLADGDLATTLQISMSLPGIVRPIERDGRLLVDGGIANNLPVSVARDMGAELIIAVDIGSPIYGQDDLHSGLTILRQLTKFLTLKNVQYQKSLLTEQDILLEPVIEGVGLLSFDKAVAAIGQGYDATKLEFAKKPQFTTLAGSDSPNLHSANNVDSAVITVNQINLVNKTRLADEYILHRLNLQEGETYGPKEIHQGVDRVYGQGTIARINTTVNVTDEQQNVLNVKVEEKEWGPGYMDFKMTFEDNFSSFSRYQLGASYRLTNLSEYGAEFASSFEFGTKKALTTELYWPIKNSGFFWIVENEYFRELQEVDIEGSGDQNIVGKIFNSAAGIGWNSTDIFDAVVAVLDVDGVINIPENLVETFGRDKIGYDQTGLMFNLNLDTLDNASFPTRGWKFNGTITRTKDQVLGLEAYATLLDLSLVKVWSLSRHSLRGHLLYQSKLNDNSFNLLGSRSLGGFLKLSGNDYGFVSGTHVRFASLVYTYELASNDFGAIDLPLYLGFSAETGNAWADEDSVDYGDMVLSNSIFVGWKSPLGPAYLAYGKSNTGDGSFYVFLGVVF